MLISKTKNILLKIFLSLLVLFLLIGCVSHVPLTKRDRSLIQSVSINEDIAKPGDIYYYGSKEVWLFATMGAIPGTVAGTQTVKGPKSMLKNVMEKDQIDIAQIVGEQFTNELKKSNLFNSIVHEKADAEFKLSVLGYGLEVKAGGFSRKLRPVLTVKGSLAKPDGSILWEKQRGVFAKGGTPSHTLEEYLENSELLREAFTIAAQIVVTDFIKDMLGEQE